MKYSYKFANLLGTVYTKGNAIFLPNADTLCSPVGNHLTLFNLKENSSETLPVTTKFNISQIAFSPDCVLAIILDEEGNSYLVSLQSKTILHKFRFQKPVSCIKFSPDGTKFIVCMEKVALMYHAPGRAREINPFKLIRSYHGVHDDVTNVDWSDNSLVFAMCSKDMMTRIHSIARGQYLKFMFGGHKDEVVACFFENQSFDLYTVGKEGALNVWECDVDFDYLDEEEDDSDSDKERKSWSFKRSAKHYFNAEGDFNFVTTASYHKQTHILCTGFESGSFVIHELPGFNWIHSLNMADHPLSSVSFNSAGDWIALACSASGQLLVWEWRSESYVMKQHGHLNNMACLDYSSDGRFLVTGGEDGKVKVWNASSGFCFVTFTEHKSGVSGVIFTSNGNVVISASLDGTVRAFDMHRYRNFRTFTSPNPVQFISLAVDGSGDIICAGSKDDFGIFLWSMQTGKLLSVLAGHEGPVVSLAFSSRESVLASGSWDGNVRLWNVLEGKGSRETLVLNHDVLAVAFSADGATVAISSLNTEITFWDSSTGVQTGTIECKYDIVCGRSELDRTSSKTKAEGKMFDAIAFSTDGSSLIAGGKFLNICIYSVEECLLVKSFTVSQNFSLDATEEFLNRRKMTDFGPQALIDTDDAKVSLPGVMKGDMCSRAFKPEVRVSEVKFSPTGREWAAVTTEGILVYSLDGNSVFSPFEVDMDITPDQIREKSKLGQHGVAITMSLKLNEKDIIREVVENVPHSAVDVVSRHLKPLYVGKLLSHIAGEIGGTRHLQFYVIWTRYLLLHHSSTLKSRWKKVLPVVNNLLKYLVVVKEELGSICDRNGHQIEFIVSLSEQPSKRLRLAVEDSDDDSGIGNFSEEMA